MLHLPIKDDLIKNIGDVMYMEQTRGGSGGGGWGVTQKIFGRGCAAGTLKTPPFHIISRLTKHTYSYNLHVKRGPIQLVNTS